MGTHSIPLSAGDYERYVEYIPAEYDLDRDDQTEASTQNDEDEDDTEDEDLYQRRRRHIAGSRASRTALSDQYDDEQPKRSIAIRGGRPGQHDRQSASQVTRSRTSSVATDDHEAALVAAKDKGWRTAATNWYDVKASKGPNGEDLDGTLSNKIKDLTDTLGELVSTLAELRELREEQGEGSSR